MNKIFNFIAITFKYVLRGFKPRYVGNLRSTEIHDIDALNPNCHLEDMANSNKVRFNQKEMENAFLTEKWDGCRWCMRERNKEFQNKPKNVTNKTK